MSNEQDEVSNNDRYIDMLEEHCKSAKLSARYSSDRLDVMIVVISTTALIISMGFANEFGGKDLPNGALYLKISWILFALTIIANLFSQLTALYSHTYEAKAARNEIRVERGKKEKGCQKKNNSKSSKYGTATSAFNMISFFSLSAAIICMLIFYIKYI